MNYFLLSLLLQIRSAFSMAFSTLTNARTILGLDPNRSILGTIIRPDPVLLERKGGSNGTMTFDHLLPGAGEPLSPQTGGQELLCNWQVEDAEEEPLPRSNPIAGDGSANSSGKKRKASKERLRNKVKEHADMEKDKSKKKRRWKHQWDAEGNDLGCYTLAGQRGMVDYMLASLAAISSFCIPTIRSWMRYAPTTSSWLLQICRERNPSGIGTDQKDSKPHTRLCFLGRFLQNWKTWVIFELVLSPPYLWTIYFMMGLNDEPNPSPLQNIHQNPSV